MTANDSDVSDRDILTGSQVVRVYGQNLTAPFVTLTFGDVEYTPLTQGEGYIEFILGDNGTATISVDGSPFMSFEVEGIVVPAGLPCDMSAGLKLNDSAAWSTEYLVNAKTFRQIDCVNYPYVGTESHPYFLFRFHFAAASADEFTLVNCSLNNISLGTNACNLNVSVTNALAVAIIEWKGFIVAVFNYPTT